VRPKNAPENDVVDREEPRRQRAGGPNLIVWAPEWRIAHVPWPSNSLVIVQFRLCTPVTERRH
jgi:hypothetical protein